MDSDEIESTSSEEDDLFDIFNLRKSSPKPKPKPKPKPQKTYSRSTRRHNIQESQSESFSYKTTGASQCNGSATESSPQPRKKRVILSSNTCQKRYFNKSKFDDSDDDDILNIDVPPVFKTSAKSHQVYEKQQQVNQKIADQKRFEELRKQQKESRMKRLLDELNQEEGRKYDLERDKAYLESLLAKDESGVDGYGISRYFCSLKSSIFDETVLSNYDLGSEISQSLRFLIARNPQAGYVKIKSQFKSFVLRSMTSANLGYLKSLSSLIRLNDDPVFNENEFKDLLIKIGLDPRLIKSDAGLVLKIEHKSSGLELQLQRLSLVFMTYLHSSDVDFETVARFFLLVISDYNANKYELRGLMSFIHDNFPLLCAKVDDAQDLVTQLMVLISGIHTCLPHHNNKEKVNKMDLELHHNIIKLINVTFAADKRLCPVIHELNLQFLLGSDYRQRVHRFTKQNLIYHIANDIIIEDNIKDLLELNDLQTADKIYAFYYKVKILPFILVNPFNFSLDREKNMKVLRSMKSSVERILQSCYGLIRDLGSVNIELVMAAVKTGVDSFSFDREEMVRFLTDLHQDLSLQCDKLESDLKVINQDFFYG
ncbi:hypothetical protein KGF57_004886 [Candida theae]|uniref:Uncharacterized protein n=1 Tax=Candida theae TaxID=1198502 RepID=A0AAD5BAR1_9ASCO|nr:uncharacterized protein KGF57_004886 [Candida theae]KAI5949056.1 hypothetical protein KGF57_004886 [Candida theae]